MSPALAGAGLSSHITQKIAALDPVGSRVIEPKIEELEAQGRRVVPVHGYPLVAPPEHITRAAIEAMVNPAPAPSHGILRLREGIARIVGEQYGEAPDPRTEVLITCGAMHGLQIAFTALLGYGDEAIVITPCYFFGGLIELAGGRAVYVKSELGNGYLIDFERIREAITPRTKLVVLSSPVNPTGYLYTQSDVEQFVSLAEEFDLLLVSDESYDRMIFGGERHISPFHMAAGRRRTVLVKSFTKSYALPGWRVGYLVADASLMPYFQRILEWDVLYCPRVNQHAALAALEGPQDWLENVFQGMQKQRDCLLEGLRPASGYQWMKPRGGPFLFLKVCPETEDETPISARLLSNYGVPAVAGRYFGGHGYVRIPFGGSEQDVRELAAALVDASRGF